MLCSLLVANEREYANIGEHLNVNPNQGSPDEARLSFGTSTQLQSIHVMPSLLFKLNGDVLAESVCRSRINAEVLKDSHCTVCDPEGLHLSDKACWTPRKAIVMLQKTSERTGVRTRCGYGI
jgi:hypothetical protein